MSLWQLKINISSRLIKFEETPCLPFDSPENKENEPEKNENKAFPAEENNDDKNNSYEEGEKGKDWFLCYIKTTLASMNVLCFGFFVISKLI